MVDVSRSRLQLRRLHGEVDGPADHLPVRVDLPYRPVRIGVRRRRVFEREVGRAVRLEVEPVPHRYTVSHPPVPIARQRGGGTIDSRVLPLGAGPALVDLEPLQVCVPPEDGAADEPVCVLGGHGAVVPQLAVEEVAQPRAVGLALQPQSAPLSVRPRRRQARLRVVAQVKPHVAVRDLVRRRAEHVAARVPEARDRPLGPRERDGRARRRRAGRGRGRRRRRCRRRQDGCGRDVCERRVGQCESGRSEGKHGQRKQEEPAHLASRDM